MSKRAILYARVSTDDQADKGYSLPSQLDLCRAYADRLGYAVDEEIREDVSGAMPIRERPEGKRLATILETRAADAVIVYQVDRLSRDIVDLLATVQKWLRAGVEVHTLDVGKVESELDIVLVIRGWQSSDERRKIRERSMRGKRQKAQRGEVVCCGRPPYGYAFLRDPNTHKVVTLAINEDEARIVRLIFRWYVLGDERGKRLSASAIALRLSEMRVPTPGEKVGSGYNRKRAAGMWQACKVIEIVSHEVYAGVWRFGGRFDKTRRRRPLDEQIAVTVPAIIDRDMWERAQMQRKHNRAMAKRRMKRDYLLRGLIKCDCGSALCGNFFSNHRYYSCAWRHNHHSGLEARTCWAKSVRADEIEVRVWEGVRGLFADLVGMRELLEIAQQEEGDTLGPKRDELADLERRIVQVGRDAEDIAKALPKSAGVVGESLQKRMLDVNALYDGLIARRATLQAELDVPRLKNGAVDEIVQFAQDVREGLENADHETKRRMLEALAMGIRVKERQYFADCLVAEWSGDLQQSRHGGMVAIAEHSRSPKPVPL